ncbi:MAG: type II secretion system F family protein, partial [Armatimonadota bacterium]|nr:type II secretion system F family protein [Armatimonadota bacterium]
MPTFVYTAVDNTGKSVKGKIEADNNQQALSKLQEQRYHVLNLSEKKESGLRFLQPKKVKLNAIAVFSRQFAT